VAGGSMAGGCGAALGKLATRTTTMTGMAAMRVRMRELRWSAVKVAVSVGKRSALHGQKQISPGLRRCRCKSRGWQQRTCGAGTVLFPAAAQGGRVE